MEETASSAMLVFVYQLCGITFQKTHNFNTVKTCSDLLPNVEVQLMGYHSSFMTKFRMTALYNVASEHYLHT
jgi:hypothetical protein